MDINSYGQGLPNFGLANTTTGFATLFVGIACLLLCYLVQRQSKAWHFAYWMIVITGIFTVTLHGFGETVQGFGPRWFWAFLDTGSNIVVTWAIALAIVNDFYSQNSQKAKQYQMLLTLFMIVGVFWHLYDRYPATERIMVIPLGKWGGFYPGEACLIAFALLNVFLFFNKRDVIPQLAKPLLYLVAGTFTCGLLLATASNNKIIFPFFSLHAIWHLVSAFGFLFLWALIHVKDRELALHNKQEVI
jgi:hypothetical protein